MLDKHCTTQATAMASAGSLVCKEPWSCLGSDTSVFMLCLGDSRVPVLVSQALGELESFPARDSKGT